MAKRKIKTTQITSNTGNFYDWLVEARQLLKDEGYRNNEIRDREDEMKAAFKKKQTPESYVRQV